MSIPALVWIDSIQVGNPIAKALLRYLATHNFQSAGFYFKNSTYMKSLEISESTLKRCFSHLEKLKFISIERRFDEHGRQTSNGIFLNIPDEFYKQYERMIEEGIKSESQNDPQGVGVNLTPLGGSNRPGGRGQNDPPYNNNINNNKSNNKRERERSLCLENKQTDHKPNQEHLAIAARRNVDAELVNKKYLLYCKKNNRKPNDDDLMKWILDERVTPKFTQEEPQRPKMRDFTMERIELEEREERERQGGLNEQITSEVPRNNPGRNGLYQVTEYLLLGNAVA